MDFLKKEEMRRQEGHAIYFEVDYALNVCKQKEKEMKEKLDRIKKQKKYDPNEEEVAMSMINMMKKAQIILYAILNLHDKAVKLALECEDIEMAKVYADKPQDKKIKKKLWMKIAKYLFNFKGKRQVKIVNKISPNKGEDPVSIGKSGASSVDVTKALQILKDSILKIDDLLPLFPEEAKVEDMKTHLCNCLDEYNNKIQDLKQQLEEHSKNAEILRKQ